MTADYDLVILGGTILDGTGAPGFTGDVAVHDGLVVAVGAVGGSATREIDAAGMIVTPGFIDVHTHYDGQLTWSEEASPSSGHGVTTVVLGNCGVGFAPCRPADRHRLVQLLEGVEDIPEIVMTEGLPWDWETFPDFIAALRRRRHDIDYAVQLPHAAVRVFVMGERAVDREQATDTDLAAMREIARAAVEAGALGIGTSRSIFHKSPDGSIIPTAHAAQRELLTLALGMRDAGGGSIQAILSVEDTIGDFDLVRQVAAETDSPMSYTLVQARDGRWRQLLARTAAANLDGPPVTGQVLPRPVGMLLGLSVSFNPFLAKPAYARIAHLPLAERVALMRTPEVREAILADTAADLPLPGYSFSRWFEMMFVFGDPPNYEPPREDNVLVRAQAAGVAPDEIVYDLLLEDEGRSLLLVTIGNYADGSLEPVREMLQAPHTVPGLGDGGAHYGMICDSTYPTFMLTYWARDRAGGRIPLPEVIASLTSRPAAMLGLTDRGRLQIGSRANVNVIDFEHLRLHAPRVIADLPGGGRRIVQDADGYVATLVGGQVVQWQGRPTGARPGTMATRERCAGHPASA